MSSSRYHKQQQQQRQQNEPFLLRATNVSSPSVIHNKASQQSIAASEDYYSLSGSSNYSGEGRAHPAQSQQTITRYQTPPELYRTPMQSSVRLVTQPQPTPDPQNQQDHAVFDEEEHQPFRKTPMRGQGKRRSSEQERQAIATTAAVAGPSVSNSVRRKPVPVSPVMEQRESLASRATGDLSNVQARSSVARGFDRDESPPTPGVDDTPYIHFALDQLTRDEEVRGSRRYLGPGRDSDGNYPYLTPLQVQQQSQPLEEQRAVPTQQLYASPPRRPAYQALAQEEQSDQEIDLADAQIPEAQGPERAIQPVRPLQPMQRQGPNNFEPVAASAAEPLRAMPSLLRPVSLGLFILFVLAYLACLIIAAVWSRTQTGLTPYGSFGDGMYFVFRYLPALIGMLIMFWLVHIQIAVYRIAPFIAMSSSSPRSRAVGAKLPLQPHGFIFPYFGHFSAGLPIFGIFVFVAWLQLFTIPLLASSFNVYFLGTPSTGKWMWIAVQGAIWATIGLYIILVVTAIVLLVWLLRCPTTGLMWDARTLADLVVLLERSNAVDGIPSDDVPRLGHWRTTHRPNDVFYTYGVADKEPRSYAVGEDGRIREKLPPSRAGGSRNNRYSDPSEIDIEGQRAHSKDAMIPPPGLEFQGRIGSALPWYLRPTISFLWPAIATNLLLAFLIVSYLPATDIFRGFLPDVSVIVDILGFSSGNFLYSFLPATIAMILFLIWLDFDMAYRRLQPFASLAQSRHSKSSSEKSAATIDGDIPDRTLLTLYPASFFLFTPLLALANGHLRVAYLSTMTLLNIAIPILASGCLWSQFSIPQQRVLIFAHPAGYYALTVFVVLYGLSYLVLLFPPTGLRRHQHAIGRVESFDDIRRLVARSQLLDDLAFHGPRDETDLVTRLLAGRPAAPGLLAAPTMPAATESKISLADSLRGFGNARAAARQQQHPALLGGEQPSAGVSAAESRYAFARQVARDGGEWWGIDRVRE